MRASVTGAVRAACALAVLAAGTTACAGGHSVLGTATGTCYQALPTAAAAVHSSGKFIGVKVFNAHDLVKKLSRRAEMSVPVSKGGPTERHRKYIRWVIRKIKKALSVFGNQKVCAVEYQGKYLPGSVEYAVDPKVRGRFAIVVMPVKGGQPTVAFVVMRLPLAFRHFF